MSSYHPPSAWATQAGFRLLPAAPRPTIIAMKTLPRVIRTVVGVLALTCLLLAGPALGSDPPRYSDGRVTRVGLEGRWVLVGLEGEGRAAPDKDAALWRQNVCAEATFARGRIMFKSDSGVKAGVYSTDGAARPAWLDLKELEGGNVEAIYELREDQLRIGFEFKILGQHHRPTRFRDKDVITLVFCRRW